MGIFKVNIFSEPDEKEPVYELEIDIGNCFRQYMIR